MWHKTEQLKCRYLRSKVEGEVLFVSAQRVRGRTVQGEGGGGGGRRLLRA
jgi:hypothetical protein